MTGKGTDMMAATAADTRYTIERMLGETPCGPVLLAVDTLRQRPVAIFTLPAERQTADRAAYDRCLNRFQRGVEISHLVQHPNLVETYDCLVDADGGARCIAEYVDGLSLQQVLARGPLPAEQALSIARAISEALDALHAQEIVHRDVAPAQVMLPRAGGVKLTGYGNAQMGRSAQTYGLGGDRPGTPGYISPEQEGGLGGVDGRSDLYGLGAVLYEMLTGEPYARQQRALALARSDLPQPLVAIVTKLLERQPAFRYQRAADVTRDLDAILHPPSSAEPAAAPPPVSDGAPLTEQAVAPATTPTPLIPTPPVPSAVTFAPPAPPQPPPPSAYPPNPPQSNPPYPVPPYRQPTTASPPVAPPPMPPWQRQPGTQPISPVFRPLPGEQRPPYPPSTPPTGRSPARKIVPWIVVGVIIFTMLRSCGSVFSTSRTVPTRTPVRIAATATRPAPTATRIATATRAATAAGGTTTTGQATRWQDPSGRISLTLPPGWRVVSTNSQPDSVATIYGDGLFMLVRNYTPTQTIDAEFAALRAGQATAFGRTFTQSPVVLLTIGGEAGKSMEWRAESTGTATTSATAPSSGIEWLVDHGGKRFSFLVSDATSARPACDALIASVTFP